MASRLKSYKLLSRGTDEEEEGRHEEIEIPEQKVPHVQTPVIEKPTPTPSFSTTTHSGFRDVKSTVEEANTPLNTRSRSFLLSLIVHILPSVTTIAIVQLSFRNVFWFDNDPNSSRIPSKHLDISLNELLNLLQFVAKIHEILLVGSLGAMVMHRVRNRLVGKKGLPFGMMTAGYSVGSAEYILSPAFWSGFSRKFMWLSLLVFCFTVFANALGPASAIALVPSLDWWPIKKPFGANTMPVRFDFPNDYWWPAELTKKETMLLASLPDLYPESLCFSTESTYHSGCPTAGHTQLADWAEANARDAAEPTISMNDGQSTAQRVVTSRLTDAGVAITTSASQTITAMIGSYWEQVRAGKYLDRVVRPKLEIAGRETWQPLVQAQCGGVSVEYVRSRPTRDGQMNNTDINTFSTTNASGVPVPDWLYDYEYNPPTKLFLDEIGRLTANISLSTNVTWLELPKDNSLSLAAVIIVPLAYQNDTGGMSQTAIAHLCSVDARWIGSSHSYDPTEDVNVAHNITDPLMFQKYLHVTDATYKDEMRKWGVSPALKLTTQWANALNVEFRRGNQTAPTFNWLLDRYIAITSTSATDNNTRQYFNDTDSVFFNFVPGKAHLTNETTHTVEGVDFNTHASNTIATLLSLQITDAMARVNSLSILEGIIPNHVNATHSSVTMLGEFAGLTHAQILPDSELSNYTNEWDFGFQRYGYGYGFRAATSYFGITILLTHLGLVCIYVAYATYDFFYVTKWTSTSWGGIAEMAALLINSPPTVELQNTCAGIDSKVTWRKNVWIREVEDGHLAVVVGEKEGLLRNRARKDTPYGTLKKGRRERRGSI